MAAPAGEPSSVDPFDTLAHEHDIHGAPSAPGIRQLLAVPWHRDPAVIYDGAGARVNGGRAPKRMGGSRSKGQW
jgi:hypothetical protein